MLRLVYPRRGTVDDPMTPKATRRLPSPTFLDVSRIVFVSDSSFSPRFLSSRRENDLNGDRGKPCLTDHRLRSIECLRERGRRSRVTFNRDRRASPRSKREIGGGMRARLENL